MQHIQAIFKRKCLKVFPGQPQPAAAPGRVAEFEEAMPAWPLGQASKAIDRKQGTTGAHRPGPGGCSDPDGGL